MLQANWELDQDQSSARVLVADDDPDLRTLVTEMLVASGYTVSGARDGEDALAKAWTERPDVIVLDVMMPKLNGYAVCRLLKADPSTAAMQIIILTARGDPDERTRGINLGADDYLAKPFHHNELIARIAARVRAKRTADNLRAREQRIRTTFQHYVVPSVVERLLDDPTRVRLGGAKQEVTALFADLRGFTALAEQTAPEDLIDLLNGYLTVAARAVQAQEGMLDKFMGDAVMALFNVPWEQPDHARRAVAAAWRLQQDLIAHRAQLPPEQQLLVSVGIHSGSAVVGNIGSVELFNFTAVGDTINVAKRLQERAEGGEIWITDSTYVQVADCVTVAPRGAHPFKGRRENVNVYQVTDYQPPSASATSLRPGDF